MRAVTLLNRRRERRSPTRSSPTPSSTRRWTATAPCARSRPPTSTCPADELDAIWSPMHLERLARTYWRYLSRVTLGPDPRRLHRDRARRRPPHAPVRAAALPRRPSTSSDADRGDRALAHPRRAARRRAAATHGYLEIDVRRCPSEEPGYGARPRRGRGRELLPRDRDRLDALVLRATPSRASTCSSRTASCARSRAWSSRSPRSGASRARSRRAERAGAERPEPVTVGDTPWAVVAGARPSAAAGRPASRARATGSPARRSARRGSPSASRSFVRSWREWMRRTVPERERMTSDSVVAPRAPS